MILCVNCGNEMDDDAIICPACGMEVRALEDEKEKNTDTGGANNSAEEADETDLTAFEEDNTLAAGETGESEEAADAANAGKTPSDEEEENNIEKTDAAEAAASETGEEAGKTEEIETGTATAGEETVPEGPTLVMEGDGAGEPAEPGEEVTGVGEEETTPEEAIPSEEEPEIAEDKDNTGSEEEAEKEAQEEDTGSGEQALIETDEGEGEETLEAQEEGVKTLEAEPDETHDGTGEEKAEEATDKPADMEAAADMVIDLGEDMLPEEEESSEGAVTMSKGRSISAFVCGILGLALCWVPIAGLVLSIFAMVLGAKARSKEFTGKRGMAVAGFIMGVVGLVISIGAMIWWIVVLTSGAKVFWLLGSIV